MTLPLVHHINYCFINRKISKFDSVTLFSSKMHSNCSNLLLKMEKKNFFSPNARDQGSTPGQGTRSHMSQNKSRWRKINKYFKNKWKCLFLMRLFQKHFQTHDTEFSFLCKMGFTIINAIASQSMTLRIIITKDQIGLKWYDIAEFTSPILVFHFVCTTVVKCTNERYHSKNK